jgi:hypothetical protein
MRLAPGERLPLPVIENRPAPNRVPTACNSPAVACYACGGEMVRSSGGKWLCRACGFLLTCCDP